MKKTLKYLTTAGMIGLASLVPIKGLEAQASNNDGTPLEEASSIKMDFGAENSIWSKFMWLGMPFSEGFVYQPVATATYKGIGANTFANVDWTNKKLKEVDLGVSYSNSKGPVNAKIGFTHMAFDNGNEKWDSETKTYLDIGVKTPLNPSLSIQRFDGYDAGNVAVFSVGGDIPKGKISWSASTAYNGGVFREKYGVGNLETSLSKSFEVSGTKFTPKIIFSKGLQSDIPNQIYGGLTVNW